jgi:hypothetical protein
MKIASVATTIRNWAALAGAVGMVGFLTFVPQHAPAGASVETRPARHASFDWPSHTAKLARAAVALR